MQPTAPRQIYDLTATYSLEATARDIPALTDLASEIPPGTVMTIPDLSHMEYPNQQASARSIHELGFEPMPHLSARRIRSHEQLQTHLTQLVSTAGVRRCFIIAGDPPTAAGPFPDSTALIDTGLFERAGIHQIGVAAHPEGHPRMYTQQLWDVLEQKCHNIHKRGMTPLIITQFVFDAGLVLSWLDKLRARGIVHPVRIGVPGPTSMMKLLRYATRCGVRASTAILIRYGISIGKLLDTTGPERFIEQLCAGLSPTHGPVSLHFFPFGEMTQTVQWINQYHRSWHRPGN